MQTMERKRLTPDERRLMAGWNELRVGSGGVPLALAEDLWRMVVVNQEPPMKVYKKLGLSRDVGARIVKLMRQNRLPSKQRLVVLSLGYPGRDFEDIAEKFGLELECVMYCRDHAEEIRKAEPLSSELWEDIDEDDMPQEEIWERAYELRKDK